MISTHLSDLDSLIPVSEDLKGIELVRHLLLLGLAVRFGDESAKKCLKNDYAVKEKNLSLPLVIMAGSTSLSKEEMGHDYKEVLLDAFKSFEGTIISGSTIAGICDIVGDVQKTYPNSIKTLGYIPNNIPENTRIDERYTVIHKTAGSDFSFLEALQYWTDIALNDTDIRKIKLVGVGGGTISAFEYRLALMFGAHVGILAKGAGSGSLLLQDPSWKDCNLTAIENSSESIEDFLAR